MIKKPKVVTLAPSSEHVDYPYDSPCMGDRNMKTALSNEKPEPTDRCRKTIHQLANLPESLSRFIFLQAPIAFTLVKGSVNRTAFKQIC